MTISDQADSRKNQKARTRAALLAAACDLIREGALPTVVEAAERAGISRATAYRYFPTQEALLLDAGSVSPLMAPVDALVANFASHDVEARLRELVDTLMPPILDNEATIRALTRVAMDTWLENRRHGTHAPVRAGRRVRYIDEALRPLEGQLTATQRRRLGSVLALTIGSDAALIMRDVNNLDDDNIVMADLRWAAQTLLRRALDDPSSLDDPPEPPPTDA